MVSELTRIFALFGPPDKTVVVSDISACKTDLAG
jgi:hypothetical protein